MDERCGLCDELWRAYAKATTEHVRLLKEQETASSAEDIVRLHSAIEIAEGTRQRAQHAFRLHLANDHHDYSYHSLPRGARSG